ncbi:universal stress protein [Streptomyces sp. NPDC050548]|uniref:universal stress protein n=1 Tax=Streptomyces sp. NPDC050548 TaxID=3365629 RepID=UPI0037916FF5
MLRPVVVGLDGSRESLAAADWAAREALRRGAPLRLVHAWEAASPEPSTLPELEAPRFWSRRILREAMDRVNERYPQVYLSGEQIARPASDALVAACAEGELLVLGSRAFSGFGGFLAGSVALATVARVTRPIVLVRADETPASERMPGSDGKPSARAPYREVVVGVDTAHLCDDVLAFAFESAAMRSAPLRAVHAWTQSISPGPGAKNTSAQEDAERELARVLGPWREKYPTVEVHEVVANDRAARLIQSASADAGLLVVGRRNRPARVGAHTGPVDHAVMHHVRCPVAIVPHE